MALRLYADLGVRTVILDEAHNMLSGTFRDQRQILAQLRYLSNELHVRSSASASIPHATRSRGDPQLASRFSLVELPAWEADADFKALVSTLLRHLPLQNPSVLDTAALQTVIRSTRGNTARVFQLFGDLAIAAIGSGDERNHAGSDRSVAAIGVRPDSGGMSQSTGLCCHRDGLDRFPKFRCPKRTRFFPLGSVGRLPSTAHVPKRCLNRLVSRSCPLPSSIVTLHRPIRRGPPSPCRPPYTRSGA